MVVGLREHPVLERRCLGAQPRADVGVDLVCSEVEVAVVLGVEQVPGHWVEGEAPESGRAWAAGLFEVNPRAMNREGPIRVLGELVHAPV
jgi:hypothetical protein